MRTNIAMLAVLASLGLSSLSAAAAETKSLSDTSRISPSERRVVNDCEPKLFMHTVVHTESSPPPPPLFVKSGDGDKGNGTHGRERDHESLRAAAIPAVRTDQPTEP